MKFSINNNDPKSNARTGILETDHGSVSTPIFMPVGTQGAVKAVEHRELINDVKAEIILGNTYHLYLRPGLNTLSKAGGLHKFINWKLPLLTDSGGFQVYSLSEARTITEEGATFKSFIDGSMHLFTPENVIDTQRIIGADIIMAFDECAPYPSDYQYAKQSMELTHRWLERCIKQFTGSSPLYGFDQTLFPIVQGSIYSDLRKHSAEYIASFELDGNAIGGLSVGEPIEEMYANTDLVCKILPADKPRYLMGVGTPANILECIAMGIDMFDCVMPTRNGRNGTIFTTDGVINIKNKKWEHDFSVLDPGLDTYVSKNFSKAYLKHLLKCGEFTGAQLASMQNLSFYSWLVESAKKKIKQGEFATWKDQIINKITRKL